eukprot:CAMPEP_0176028552 /NCGR_PEP_ID=MMETSP0120_2-20121206/14016_1 /TAXON_ID=160619 /ORGANISM="Kryptoperidinium foliaceum, Strain CCMP 1326" /LENGTH=298 /DNA_ID=CAMNT_0017361765 /DNA_START=170 /DNA_END=1066 /DNA_ORIENTATION=-
MQILSQLPQKFDKSKPPILFLHGSFHGAWCWAEHFFPFFADECGYVVVAPSWRGTGGTYAGDGVSKVKITEHASDLKEILERFSAIAEVPENLKPPVLVAHSFGGLAVMKALEDDPGLASKISGIAMMCSVPPSGNGKMTLRFLRRSLIDSYKITVGFAGKKCLKNDRLLRELFFGGPKQVLADGSVEDFGISDQDLKRYQKYFTRDSVATIDLVDLAKQLPSAKTINGRAPFIDELPPCLILGASRDFIVDREGVQETATYFGNDRPSIVDSPHDVMLGAKWKNAAALLLDWMAALH